MVNDNERIMIAEGERPSLLAVLPRGEAIRNLVYTGALDEVAEEAEVRLLTVVPSDAMQEMLDERYGEIEVLKNIRPHRVVGFTREMLNLVHGRWLWSKASEVRWHMRDYEADTLPKKIKRWGKKALTYPLAHRRGVEWLASLEGRLSHALRGNDHYVRLLKARQPDLVFNASHVHSTNTLAVIHAARSLGIPTATFIFSWDNLTSQGRVFPAYDHYLVWNEDLRDQLLDIYRTIRPEQVFITGTPQFDTHFDEEHYWTRQRFCAHVGADPARPIVLYTTGMAHHMPGETLIVETIARILREMSDLGPPQLLVRVYPKDQTGRFEPMKAKLPDVLFPDIPWEPNWLTPLAEDGPLLVNMLRHAALGLNVASTVSLELCMFDKPVVNVGYNPPGVEMGLVDFPRYYTYEHYRPIVASGAVAVATSEGEMQQMIREALTEPRKATEARARLLRGFFGDTLDGKSGSRVAAVLKGLMAKKEDVVCAPNL